MSKLYSSVSGLSILMALALALGEWYFFFLRRNLGRSAWFFYAESAGLQFGVADPCISFLPASLDPPCDRHKTMVHRRSGWDGVFDPARDRPRCDIREAGAFGHARAVGGSILTAVYRCD